MTLNSPKMKVQKMNQIRQTNAKHSTKNKTQNNKHNQMKPSSNLTKMLTHAILDKHKQTTKTNKR